MNYRASNDAGQAAFRYLIRLGVFVFCWAALSIMFIVLVDPYRMYGTPGIPGWTELKPRVYQQSDIAKIRQLQRVRPKTLLLGNSRVEIGLDPESKVWPASYQPVFNAAEAGRGLPTAVAMLREDIALRPPQTVFLGLDFQDFLSRQDRISASQPSIAPGEDGGRALQIWRDRFATTLTFDALSDSVLTVFDQNPKITVTMTRLGFNPLHEYRLYAQRTGYYGLFSAKAKDYREQYSRYKVPDFSKPDELANFHDLAVIVTLAHDHRIRLIFFTQPYHAAYLEMLHHLGLWSSFEQWKRSVAQFSAAAGVPLFDFAEYDPFTTEQVPAPGITAEMHWYWEPGHYKEALGNELVKAMLNGTPSSLGRRLTPMNMDAAINAVREQRIFYIAHRDEISAKIEASDASTPTRPNDQ